MSQQINQIVLSLLEARVTLYPATTGGAPVLTAPIWTGAPAEKLSVRERWRIKETTPTGARYPRRHPLIPDYEIALGRVWLLPADLTGWSAGWQNYVLDVTWTEEETGQWHRRTFYGVTIGERGLDSRDIESGFTDDQSFAAQYFVPASGAGYPAAIAATLPYLVTHTGTDGVPVLLYTYDPATAQFTAVADTAGRATLGYDAGNNFVAVMAGQRCLTCLSSPAQRFRAAMPYRKPASYRSGARGLLAGALQTATVPVPAELPRLDFYQGTLRLATVTASGIYHPQFTQTVPGDTAGKFALYANHELVATLGAAEVAAQDFLTQ